MSEPSSPTFPEAHLELFIEACNAHDWLKMSVTSKVLLTVDPGAVVRAPTVGWAETWSRVDVHHLGTGLHLVPEEHPEAFRRGAIDLDEATDRRRPTGSLCCPHGFASPTSAQLPMEPGMGAALQGIDAGAGCGRLVGLEHCCAGSARLGEVG